MTFSNATARTEIYTLSLHDALPISPAATAPAARNGRPATRLAARKVSSSRMLASVRTPAKRLRGSLPSKDRKSTRLNSSHVEISYAVFCLKKKKPSDALHSHPDVAS